MIDLVLGAGGARGLCALGALKVLEGEGIFIKRVIGASMGAIIGAAYCSGQSPGTIEGRLRKERVHGFARLSWRGPGLCSNESVRRMIGELVGNATFRSLRTPLLVHCTDLQSGKGVAYDTGDLVSVVTGSSLAAGIYCPMEYDEKLLVDGGYTNPVPVYLARSDVACAVDPTVAPDWNIDVRSRGIFDTRAHKIFRMSLKSIDIMIWNIAREKLARSDAVLVQPSLDGVQFTEFEKSAQIISAGERAMLSALPELRERLSASQRGHSR